MHPKTDHIPTGRLARHGGEYHNPKDVSCVCGMLLRYTVPLFFTGPYGWEWRIVTPKQKERDAAEHAEGLKQRELQQFKSSPPPKPVVQRKPRLRFSGKTYLEFHQTENAMRCDQINAALDAGRRVFGDPVAHPPTPKDKWVEVDEATHPRSHGLEVRTKDDRVVTIFAYDASDKAVSECRPQEAKGEPAAKQVQDQPPEVAGNGGSGTDPGRGAQGQG